MGQVNSFESKRMLYFKRVSVGPWQVKDASRMPRMPSRENGFCQSAKFC
jgi:hypothetical protein